MKRCPECRRDYTDETLNYCLDDGVALLDGPSSLQPPTQVLSMENGEAPTIQQNATTGETAVLTPQTSQHLGRGKSLGKWIAAITGVLLIGVAAIGYGGYLLFSSMDSPAARPAATVTAQRLTGDGKARGAEISPDGKFLAYIRAEGGQRSIWLKQIKTQSNIPIVQAGELDRFDRLAFSPDGEFLYFNAQTEAVEVPSVYRVATLGGTPTKVFSDANSVQFSLDGQKVSFGRVDFVASESAIYVANSDGTNEQKIASRNGSKFFNGAAVWSPDGKTIAVASGDDSHVPLPHIVITLIPVEGGATVDLGTTKWREVSDLAWHPTGDSIIVAATDSALRQPQLWEVAFPSGEMRRLTNNLHGHFSVSITSDGKSIVTGEIFSRTAVWVSPDLKPENAKAIMPSSGDTWGFSWTPDNRIVYVSDQTGDAEVWIMDADGGNAKPITSDRIFKTTPVVSSDGRYVVYTSNDRGGEIVRIDLNGSNRVVLQGLPGADNPDISPDAKWVIFSAWVEGKPRVLRIPIDGGVPITLTDYAATEPRYSRDGTRFACFIADEKSQDWNRLAIVQADGGQPIKVFQSPGNTNVSRGPIWTPDDRGITLVVAPGEKQNLWLQPVDGGPGKAMTDFEVPGIARREYSRDGKRIAIVRAEGVGNAIMITDFR